MSDKRPPNWKLVENVVTAIERSLNTVAGTKVVPNASVAERVGGVPRQVDVYVEIPTGPRTLRIGVEVRNKSAPLDITEVEQLVAKLGKLDIDYGCIVSSAGFSASGKAEAERNGIEIRTLTEIENPNWWLVSAMRLSYTQVELLRWQINFSPDEIDRGKELLAGINGTDVELTLPSGESGTLHAFVASQGARAVKRPELAHLNDQDTFNVVIDFSEFQSGSLKCCRGPVPMPANVYALYRLHRQVEAVKLSVYETAEGVNAFTGVSQSWGKQVTLVTKLQQDGSRSLSMTFDDTSPPKAEIGACKLGSN